jgi:hypothetical protein
MGTYETHLLSSPAWARCFVQVSSVSTASQHYSTTATMATNHQCTPSPDDAVPQPAPADATPELLVENAATPLHDVPPAEAQEPSQQPEPEPPVSQDLGESIPPPESPQLEPSIEDSVKTFSISGDTADDVLAAAALSDVPDGYLQAETPDANGNANGTKNENENGNGNAHSQDIPMPSIEGTYTAEGFFIPSYEFPPELDRIPSGCSVLDVESITGDFGRTYHGYKEGKYLFPNDGVRTPTVPWLLDHNY